MGDDQHGTAHRPAAKPLRITTAAGPDGEVVLTAAGPLVYQSAGTFTDAVEQAFAAGAPMVVADVAAIEFCDSSGLAALVRAHKAAHRLGRRFTVRHPDRNLSRILAVTGLGGVLDVIHPESAG